MKIGIDFYGTVTKHPELFWEFIESNSHELWIVSAVRSQNVSRMINEAHRYQLHVPIEPVVFEDYEDVPQMKLNVCKRLGLHMLIDDRLDTVELVSKNGIIGLHVV